MRLVEDALVLAADAAWSEVINTVLVMKGVTVDELRSAASSPDVWRVRRPLHHLSRTRGGAWDCFGGLALARLFRYEVA
jgi:hypothetical protein